MKKSLLYIVNIAMILGIFVFIFIYTKTDEQKFINAQKEIFLNLTERMSQITGNYIEGEQLICNSWANYINKTNMSINDALNFVRRAQVYPESCTHIIFTDDASFEGLSTIPKNTDSTDFSVSYRDIKLFPSIETIDNGSKLNITRTYTNPMNGLPSLGFYNKISVRMNDNSLRQALLLRIIPISLIEKKWVFPTERYEGLQFSVIDFEGNYIIREKNFKNTNFFEFYKSYNYTDIEHLEKFKAEIKDTECSTETMLNSKSERCLIAHSPITDDTDWIIVSSVPVKSISAYEINWPLILAISLGLLAVFVFNLAMLLKFNQKLSIATQEAKAANKAKTDFLSAMSHDIRTPMNAIIGLTTITERNVTEPELVSDNLKKITLASNHLLTLINDILDISKVESGKFSLSPLSFSIVDSAENLVNISQPIVRQKNLDFRFRVKDIDYEYLFADQLRLNQIFINILSNALKYTPENKSVSVDMFQEKSEKEGFTRLNYVVSDTGIGMSSEFMQDMYQPFSRQTDSRVNKIQGTGLGLAITKKMVDLMDGKIECKSEEGVGTTFKISIDLKISETRTDDLKLPPLDILIIDDDEVLLETAKSTLTELGTKAETADTVKNAISRITEKKESGKKYSVIILDWKMPEMSGIELTEKIREIVGNEIPILLVSSYDWSQIEEVAKKSGINGFISKPLFKSSLYKKISDVLHLKNENKQQEENNSDLKGLNILVAEDMDVNWEIISTLLGMYEITSERAINGKEAIEKIKDESKKFDLIFMDIQMPVMNGLEGTKGIRSLSSDYAKKIPIIAMTADAFSENVAACLEVGMNSHIAKPIDIKHVLKEIRNNCKKN